jgi:monoamine oxidase
LYSQYRDDSLYDFLRSQRWSTDAINAFALVEGMEVDLDIAFLDVLQIYLQWLGAGMVHIDGGMDRLPRAFLPALQNSIRFGAEVVALDYTSNSVTVYYQSPVGLEHVTGDFAVLTIPFSTMRFVDVVKPFSPGKQMAIRQLHYDNAVKVFLQCRRRFWEEDEGLFGGYTITDLPIQQIYYPDHGRETKQGVLIGCYAYGEEANRWASLPAEDRILQTLKYVAQIHPQVTKEFEVGYSKVWGDDKFAGGLGALFEPSQQFRLHPHIVGPEGPIHFAGEHTSLKHLWIEGAVESGLRAAQEVHERSLVANSR